MKKLAIIGAAVGLLVTLVGCGDLVGETPSDPIHTIGEGWYKTGDGRVVWCMRVGNGASCDWAGAVDRP